MTVGNIATDGYGLNVTEKPNVPVNGYGTGVPTGLFAGSVTGDPVADEIIEGFFDDLLLLDSELETVAALIETVEVTELVGIPMAQSLMVGVSGESIVTSGVTAETALEDVLSASVTMDSSANVTSTVAPSTHTTTTDITGSPATGSMMGDDETETGVV